MIKGEIFIFFLLYFKILIYILQFIFKIINIRYPMTLVYLYIFIKKKITSIKKKHLHIFLFFKIQRFTIKLSQITYF
jgi:hypothetical protein